MLHRKTVLWLAIAALVIAFLAVARVLTAPATTGTGGASGSGAGPAAGAKSSRQEGGGPADKTGGSRGAPGGSKPAEVSIQVLKTRPLSREVLSSGTLLAKEEVDLKTETQGRIVGVHFKEGSKVKKGTLLVKLNDAEIRAQIRKLETQLKLAGARESRQATLLSSDLVSKEEYEIALEEKNGLLSDRDLLKAQLAKTEILAPFDGVIGLKEVSEGSNVASGTRIAGLFSLDPLKVDFSIPEQYFGQVKPGDTVLISVEGIPLPVKGAVYAMEPKVDPATRMLRIRGYCPNPEGRIPPGASARVRLLLETIPDAIMVPSMAVIPDIKGQRVMLYKGGKAASASVKTGYRTEDEIQVEGVSAGDSLIVSGLIQLKPGSAVRPAADGQGRQAEAKREGG